MRIDMTHSMRIILRTIADSTTSDDPTALASKLEPEAPIDVPFDPVTSAMLIAARELWSGARDEHGDPRATILAHAVQLGLALMFRSHDLPDTYNPPHDGCLDMIDELRHCLGLEPLGDDPLGLLEPRPEVPS